MNGHWPLPNHWQSGRVVLVVITFIVSFQHTKMVKSRNVPNVRHIFEYLINHKYPETAKANEKRSIRRAATQHFRVGELYLLILHIYLLKKRKSECKNGIFTSQIRGMWVEVRVFFNNSCIPVLGKGAFYCSYYILRSWDEHVDRVRFQ